MGMIPHQLWKVVRIPSALWGMGEILALILRGTASQGKVLGRGVTIWFIFGTHQAGMSGSMHRQVMLSQGHGYQIMAMLQGNMRMNASHKAKAMEELRRVQTQDTF